MPRVNEDEATKTPVEVQPNLQALPAEDDRDVLRRIVGALPIFADLARGDVFLFGPTDDPYAALVLAEAKPATVPSILTESWAGRRVTAEDEPAVVRALDRGSVARRFQRVRVAGHPTVQDVYPVRNGARVIAALAVEVGLVESERQTRKSIVYRRAIDRLRRLVAAGRLQGAELLGRLTEHDGPMVISGTGQILYISSLAEQLYRKIGYNRSLLHHSLEALRTDESAFFKALESGACVEQVVQEGPYTWLRRAFPLAGEDPDRLWARFLTRFDTRDVILLTVLDVTDETRKERELKIKSAMIQEIHHRVKNNLQTIAALLRLQARRTGSPEVGAMLQETINRILSIAIVHEFLARQDSTDVDMRDVAQQIVGEVTRSVLDPEKRIHFSLEATSVCLPTQQATSCALVLNELLHNTVEHGFARLNEGSVAVRLRADGDRVVVEVADNGEGLPADFRLSSDRSLGLQIVQTLVREDLKGTFELVNAAERGARAIVAFPAAFLATAGARPDGTSQPSRVAGTEPGLAPRS